MSESAPAATPSRLPRRFLLAGILLLCLLRLHLTWGIPTTLCHFAVDDLHYLRQAEHIAEGRWLGPYDMLTLTKGAGYPLFLAAAHHAGIPRLPAEAILRILTVLVLAFALRRLGASRALTLLAAALALFSVEAFRGTMQRPLREGVYASQTLLLFALGIGMLAETRLLARLAWTIGVGAVAGWLHHTREEGVWLLPCLLMAMLALWLGDRGRGLKHPRALAQAALAVAMVLGIVAGTSELVRWQNEAHYGERVTLEAKETEFAEALAALRRITLADWKRFEPLDAAARHALYRVSPAFAELRGILESTVYADTGMLAENGERMFSFMNWAIRYAASLAGHHASLPEARRYYGQLAAEINAACDRGVVKAVDEVGSSHPGVHLSELPRLFDFWRDALTKVFVQEPGIIGRQLAWPQGTLEQPEESRRRRFLRESLPPPGGSVQRDRLAGIAAATKVLIPLLPWFALSGLAAWLLCLLRPRRALTTPAFWIAGAAIAAILVRSLLIAIINTYWWHYGEIYLAAVTPVACILGPLGLFAACAVHGGSGHVLWARTRDVLILLGLPFLLTLVIRELPEARFKVTWPLDLEQQAALRQPGGRAALSAAHLRIEEGDRGLILSPKSPWSSLTTQPLDIDRHFTDAMIELSCPPGGPFPLQLEWGPPISLHAPKLSRVVFVPGGRPLALRMPMDPGGVGLLTLRGIPMSGETRIRSFGLVPGIRPRRGAGAFIRGWIHRSEPRQIICEISGAPAGTDALVQFSTRRRRSLEVTPGVAGALEIDLEVPLEGAGGERIELKLKTDADGFCSKSFLLPEGVSLPRGNIFVQAALPGRFLPSSILESLRITPVATADLPPRALRR